MYSSFYIHWPFCPYKCHFCPFVAFAGQDSFMGQYHNALKKEINDFFEQYSEKLPLKTIYFGGGTPSTYPDDLLLDTFGTLRKVSNFSDIKEITLEVNPGTVTRKKLEHWKELGINRLSIGVQSLNEKALKEVNRLQTNSDVCATLQYAQGLFENISIDLILGLPDVTEAQWKEQLAQIVQWPIKHIAVYFLTVHEFTPLYYKVKKNAVVLPPDDQVVELYAWTVDYLQEHGFDQYEISNFARDGFQSVHNKAYWNRVPYRGFGVGAWSFDGQSRFMNKKNLSLYMKGVDTGVVTEFYEQLSQEQVLLESIMLGLRQKEGLDITSYYDSCSSSHAVMHMQKIIEELIGDGLLMKKDGRLQLTVKGVAVEHEIIARITP